MKKTIILTKSGKPDMRYSVNKALFGNAKHTASTSSSGNRHSSQNYSSQGYSPQGYSQRNYISSPAYYDSSIYSVLPPPSPQKITTNKNRASFSTLNTVDPVFSLESMLCGLHISEPSPPRTPKQNSASGTATGSPTASAKPRVATMPIVEPSVEKQPKTPKKTPASEKPSRSRQSELPNKSNKPTAPRSKSDLSHGSTVTPVAKTKSSVSEDSTKNATPPRARDALYFPRDYTWEDLLAPPEQHLSGSPRSVQDKKDMRLKENRDSKLLLNADGSPDRRRKENRAAGESITSSSRTDDIRDEYRQQKFRKDNRLTEDQHAAHVIGLDLKLRMIRYKNWDIKEEEARRNQDLVAESRAENLSRDKAIDEQIFSGIRAMEERKSDPIVWTSETSARLGQMTDVLKAHIDDRTATALDRCLYKEFTDLQGFIKEHPELLKRWSLAF